MTVHDVPLEGAARTLRNGTQTPREFLDELLEHVDAVEPEVEALVEESDRESRLRREAAAVAAEFDEWDLPPLYGVPVGVKDIFHVDGLPTRAGSELPPTALAGPQADVVSTLKDAGAVVLGKTVTTEFAYYDPGPTRNPHDLDHTPGGSSTGSAAAVAAGLCPLALGTQTAGSTIRPAAFCGIVGFKPSLGRIPTGGVIPFSRSADHIGLFTQDVAGMRRAAGVVCPGWEPVDPDEPTLGVPADPYLEQAEDVGLQAFEQQVERLEAAGYDVRRVDVLEDIESVNDRHIDLITAEAALVHREWYQTHGDSYREHMTELLEDGNEIRTGRLAEGRAGQEALRERLADRMDEHGVDLWISPAAPGPAPEGIDDTGDPVMNVPWTHSGLPTVSLPAGTVDGLPLGLQVSARFGAGERLLSWCEELVEAL